MAREEGRTLTEPETQDPLRKHTGCYVCLESLAGCDRPEIEFDHIHGYADGIPQDLSSFGPVGASSSDHKRNCHAAQARKPPLEYRGQLRIKKASPDVTVPSPPCPSALPSVYESSTDRRTMLVSARLQHSY